MAVSYGTYTITEVQEGSQIWTTTVEPATPNYTFTISNLVGDSDTSVKVGDIIMYSYYRYTVLSVSSDGTTVLTGNRTSIRGGTGAASTTYSLIVSNLAIIKDKNGTVSPTSITLTAKYQTGSSAMANYSGRFKIETTTNNSTWTTQYTSSANEATKDWTVIDGIVAIRCNLYLKDGTTTLLDQQTIPVISDGIDGTNITITSTSVTYQEGTSGTVKPTGTWGTAVPTVAQGNYLWTKTVVNYNDGSSTESYSVARQGNNGTNGTSPTVSSTVIQYQQSTNGSTVPTGSWSNNPPTAVAGQYMWTKTTVKYSDNAEAVSYSVSKNGTNGTNGSSISITSTSVTYQSGTSGTTKPTGTWQTNVPTVAQGNYLWTKTIVNYSDNSSTESYSVARQGSNGTNGTSPTVTNTVVEYQQSTNGKTVPTGSWSTTPPTAVAEQFIWSRTTITYSDNATAVSYSVSRNGTNGTSISISSTSVTYQKGTSGTTKPTGTWETTIPSVGQGEYLWTKTVVTYSDSSKTESYSVSRNAVNGTNGTNGTNGKDGVSPTVSSTVTEYVQSDSGTTTPTSGWNTTPPTATAGKYMWTKVTVTYSDNATAVSYTVSKNGANGTNGINTATVYLYKRGTTAPSVPSGNTTYTFSTKQLTGTLDSWSQTIPTTGSGQCYVTAAVASSNGTTDTIGTGEWSTPIQFNGTNGTNGTNGINGTNGTNGLNQATIFLYKRGSSVTKPTTSVTYTFSTGALSAEPNSWKRNIPTIDGNPCWVVTATAIGNGTTATIAGSNWSDPIKLVEDGEDGKDAYTVILTNENHTFAGDTTSAIGSEIECNVIAYKGATQVVATIGTITGQPTGMTTALLNNGTVNAAFKVTVTTAMTTKNGILNVPVTVDGKTFTKKFTYTLTLDGEKGDTAQWYYGEGLTHTSGNATLPISQTADVTVGAMYLNTKTGTCYKCTAISGSNATWTYAGNITDGINIGGRNIMLNTLYPNATGSDLKRPHIKGQTTNTSGRGTCTVAEHGIRFTTTSANWQYIYFGSSNNSATPDMIGLEAGETYTLSADLSWKILSSSTGKANTTTYYMGAFLSYSTSSNLNSWSTAVPHNQQFPITQADKGTDMSGKLVFTFTVPSTAVRLYLGIRADNDITASHYAVGDYIEARNIKLEKGNKATDWTPAPEDIDASIATKADSSDAVLEEQYIYISKASGTASVTGTTTWVTESGDVQNTWSTKRPTYTTNYPVLFIAKQKKTVDGSVTCTTPVKDDTTTVIDGGHITTGTIDASKATITNIDASNISTGTLNADRIGANSIDASKINVSSISIGISQVTNLQPTLNGKQPSGDYATNTTLSNSTGWSVIINISAIDYTANTATLHATVYKDGAIKTSGFTLQWYKTVTATSTTTTAISGATSSTLSVTSTMGLDAAYTCIVS